MESFSKANPICFDSVLDRLEDRGGLHFVAVPAEIAQQVKQSGHSRLVCTLNHLLDFHCAIQSDGQGGFFILVGTDIRRKLKLAIGQRLSLSIIPDTSEFGRPMPEEFQAVLDTEDEGRRLFLELKPSMQRNILYWVSSAKSVDKRIERSLEMIRRLK
ncbi:MAG: DUF1905 domain-containing protein [Siphonobacter aquaeclarae]|nr:DUF1905 domain-containing protein [Siphonobacter aquaeclarae]